MNKQAATNQWCHYIEINHTSSPVKIDTILRARMRAFTKARRSKKRTGQR